MREDELREKQIVAAVKVMQLLSPPAKQLVADSVLEDLWTVLPENTQSMIAASTIFVDLKVKHESLGSIQPI